MFRRLCPCPTDSGTLSQMEIGSKNLGPTSLPPTAGAAMPERCIAVYGQGEELGSTGFRGDLNPLIPLQASPSTVGHLRTKPAL